MRGEVSSPLYKEGTFQFAPERYQLKERLLECLGLRADTRLQALHELFKGDRGKRGNRREKKELLEGLTVAERRKGFHETYHRFVLEAVCKVFEAAGETEIYFQQFPCIRIVRPGEFSIGPHADSAYGFAPTNINFYLPLSEGEIKGTNSLWVESEPGKEDWHG